MSKALNNVGCSSVYPVESLRGSCSLPFSCTLCVILIVSLLFHFRVFIRHQRLDNSPSTTQNSPAKFRSFLERALLFHNNSPATLQCSPATTIKLFLIKTLHFHFPWTSFPFTSTFLHPISPPPLYFSRSHKLMYNVH